MGFLPTSNRSKPSRSRSPAYDPHYEYETVAGPSGYNYQPHPYQPNHGPPQPKPTSEPSYLSQSSGAQLDYVPPRKPPPDFNTTKDQLRKFRQAQGKATKQDRSRNDPFIDNSDNVDRPNQPPPRYATLPPEASVNDRALASRTMNELNHSNPSKPFTRQNVPTRFKRAAADLVNSHLHYEGVSKSNDPKYSKHEGLPKQRPTEDADIEGLRNQITANAVALCWNLVAKMPCPTELFTVFVMAGGYTYSPTEEYVAVLAYCVDSTNRSPPALQKAGQGREAPSVKGALKNLLDLTVRAFTESNAKHVSLLHTAVDPDRWWNPSGVKILSFEGFDSALLNLETLPQSTYNKARDGDVERTRLDSRQQGHRAPRHKHREREGVC